jgi:hypothetical protein
MTPSALGPASVRNSGTLGRKGKTKEFVGFCRNWVRNFAALAVR